MRAKPVPLVLAAVLLGLAALTAPAAAQPPPESRQSTVTLGGVAFDFSNGEPIAEARVTVDETGQSVRADGNGRWSLEVPAGSDATLKVSKLGWYPMYTQTFQDLRQDIDDIYLQTPNLLTTGALWALVAVQRGQDPFEGGCVVVSTVVDKRAVGMSFEEMMDFVPHGVPGATASASPALESPLYFNDAVRPDLSFTETSTDGGVMWTNVPAGTYTFEASHPTEEFAPFTATCEGNRFINASPPHGLHGTP